MRHKFWLPSQMYSKRKEPLCVGGKAVVRPELFVREIEGGIPWSAEETDIGHGIALFRAAPGEVLAEREAAWAAELTPNIVVLGDPLPGRSALDAKHRTPPH